jgi:hypothetical protein
MTLCRSRGETGGVRNRGEQSQYRLGCSVRRSRFSSGVCSTNSVRGPLQGKPHCLVLESSPLDRLTRENFGLESCPSQPRFALEQLWEIRPLRYANWAPDRVKRETEVLDDQKFTSTCEESMTRCDFRVAAWLSRKVAKFNLTFAHLCKTSCRRIGLQDS